MDWRLPRPLPGLDSCAGTAPRAQEDGFLDHWFIGKDGPREQPDGRRAGRVWGARSSLRRGQSPRSSRVHWPRRPCVGFSQTPRQGTAGDMSQDGGTQPPAPPPEVRGPGGKCSPDIPRLALLATSPHPWVLPKSPAHGGHRDGGVTGETPRVSGAPRRKWGQDRILTFLP